MSRACHSSMLSFSRKWFFMIVQCVEAALTLEAELWSVADMISGRDMEARRGKVARVETQRSG